MLRVNVCPYMSRETVYYIMWRMAERGQCSYVQLKLTLYNCCRETKRSSVERTGKWDNFVEAGWKKGVTH